VNYPSFIWNPLVESCGSLTLPPFDSPLERNLSNKICFCLFFKNFQKCCTTLSLNRLILLFTTAILGRNVSTKREDHVILCLTFQFQVVRTSNRSKFEGQLYSSIWQRTKSATVRFNSSLTSNTAHACISAGHACEHRPMCNSSISVAMT
jgi:hypothetical protein